MKTETAGHTPGSYLQTKKARGKSRLIRDFPLAYCLDIVRTIKAVYTSCLYKPFIQAVYTSCL